jgi:hypothetical protein
MANDVLSTLVKQFEDERKVVLDTLSRGAAQDFAEYKRLCGVLAGFERSQMLILEMEKRLQKQDD